MSRRCHSLILAWLLVVAGASAAQEPDAAPRYDPQPKVIRQGLKEIFSRRALLAARTMDPLVKDGTCPGELLIYRDVETGAEVQRRTWHAGYNAIHSHINRSPWNADGSLLAFRSDRGMPGVWKREETGRGDPHPYLMQPDGSSFKLFGPTAPGFTTVYGRHMAWDIRDPHVAYWPAHTALWRTVLTPEGTRVEKVVDLPNADRRKEIFPNISESNLIMVKDQNSHDYRGEVYVVDPAEGKIVHRYEYGLALEWPGHDVAKEFGFHDCTFRRNPESSYVINYGPSGSVGEPLFFEMPLDGNKSKVKICYPSAADPNIPYYSHPAWGPGGKQVSYFGLEEFGEAEKNPGWHIRDHDARKPVVRLIDGWVGGHIAWDGYDGDWVFAAVGSDHVAEWNGWIAHAWVPSGRAQKLTRHHSRENGGPSNYAAIPRPAQSPDGTKCLFHSTMLQTSDEFMDIYIAVSHRPAPPADLKLEIVRDDRGAAARLTWTPPKMHREIRGYLVYARPRPELPWNCLSREPVTGTTFTDGPYPDVRNFPPVDYMVTSLEHSGLESDRTSPVVRVADPGAEVLDKTDLTGWDRAAPEPPGDPTLTETPAGPKLTWRPSPSDDVRYVNVYFSTEHGFNPEQSHRIASVVCRPPDPRDVFPSNEYTDWSAPNGVKGWYILTAVDRQGNESAPAIAGP